MSTLRLKKPSQRANLKLVEEPAQKPPEAALEAFKERFPAVFTKPTPLKIGTREELIAACPDLSKGSIRRALKQWCRSKPYLEAVTEGVTRINIHGKPACVVTSAQQAHAKTRLSNAVEGGKHEEQLVWRRELPR
jgi:sRNA-binding protein